MRTFCILTADVLDGLRDLPDGSVRCCVTSPPYWGLRDYGHDGQLGLERTPEEYVGSMVEVFREVRRVLADDGTLWLNLGDSYATRAMGLEGLACDDGADCRLSTDWVGSSLAMGGGPARLALKAKDLVGIPWRVAFALQADGWYLRQDIVWAKPNPMPESVRDRCTKAHEYVFLLSKSARYYYDAAAVAEAGTNRDPMLSASAKHVAAAETDPKSRTKANLHKISPSETRNRRSVWTVPTKPFPGAHFAVMPEALVEPCILAGSAEGNTVLDPFAGSGTVGVVALRLDRAFVGIELNPEYADMARERITGDAPLLNSETPSLQHRGTPVAPRIEQEDLT